jgi:molecular chaperone GrpE
VSPGGGNDRDDALAAGGTEPQAAEGTPESPATGLAPVEGEPVAPLTREEIEALRRECSDLKDQILRRRADFENYRRRVERDRQAAALEAEAGLLRSLIPSLDNLDRALEAPGGQGALREGVELTRREILTTLEARGVVVEDPTGQLFDPEAHQALSHEPAENVPDGTVIAVLRKGYRLRDRLLRPALVKVAKGRDGDGPEALD